MRVTGGVLCGREIACPDGVIRPAMDRMRESVFAVLGDLSGKSFLDVFSGSGSISIEAASRGAACVALVENDKIKIPTVLKNVSMSPIRIDCHFVSAELFLKRTKAKFDRIFFDPPFPYKFHRDLVESVSKRRILADGGLAMIHRPAELSTLTDEIGDLIRCDQRIYGRSVVDFYTWHQPKTSVTT